MEVHYVWFPTQGRMRRRIGSDERSISRSEGNSLASTRFAADSCTKRCRAATSYPETRQPCCQRILIDG